MASIIQYNNFYPASTGTMGAAAAVNDVLVVACGSATLVHATATVTGATATMAEQQFQSGTGTSANAVTILTGLVTGAGTPAFTISADADMGFGCWIVRGLSSPTKNTGNGAFGVGNPLTATGNPSVTASLFIAYLNENTTNWTSWNGSISPDSNTVGHADAFGHQLGMSSGSYTPGANVTSHGDNTIAFVFLPETVAASSDGTPLGPYHADGPGQGPRLRRMSPQKYPTPAPVDTVTPSPSATPFHIGSAGKQVGMPQRRMIPQQYPDTIPFVPDGSATQTPFRIGRGGGIGTPARRMFPQRYPDSVAVNPDVTRPLTGVSETSAVGALGVQHTNAIAGVSTTTAVGSVKATLTKALTGASTIASVGTLGVARARALAGISTATTSGTMLSSRAVPITGAQATGSVGTVTATTGIVIALTGVSVSLSVGTLIAIAQSAIIATGGGASGAQRYRQPAWWGDEQKRKLKKKVEAVQKQIEKKRQQVDFAPDLYRMERLIEQIQELQKRLMKLLEQIDEINKQAGEEEVAVIYAIYRSLH